MKLERNVIMNCKSCFAACSRPFYRLYGQCCHSFGFIRRFSSRTQSRKIVLMLVGLDNAGKSSTAKGLAREPVDSVVPTVGFNSVKLKHRGFSVTIYDLGGSSQIRGIWHRYFVDVHGIIFVVDASDVNRIDESRKVLEELLVHENLAGKPLLLLANKQDCEGALDELDVVERLDVETLVNLQKCPTLVKTCSAAGAPSGSKPQLDPGILDGYRWLLRRIITDYEVLNARVEIDSEQQRGVIEAARQEWLRRKEAEPQTQESELQADRASDSEGSPFKPITTFLNGHSHTNGHVGPVSDDSPDSSSHTVGGEGSVYIPLHSPRTTPLAAEPGIVIISEPQPADVVLAVKEQFEWKMKKQRKKLLLRRCNRTAPSSADSGKSERTLPPLKGPHPCSWTRPVTAKSLPSQGWGLGLSLEEVEPPTASGHSISPSLRVVKSPRSLVSSDSDKEDVIVCTDISS